MVNIGNSESSGQLSNYLLELKSTVLLIKLIE